MNKNRNDETDILAAEYVLRLLPDFDHFDITHRLKSDEALRDSVMKWETDLAQLADAQITRVPAPDLLPAIERNLFGEAEATSLLDRWLAGKWFWRGLILAVLTIVLVKVFVLKALLP